MRGIRRLPVLLALLLAVAFTGAVLAGVRLRSDLADFLPRPRGAAGRIMLRELQSSSAASLLLLAVEGAPPAELARIDRRFADRLRRSGAFAYVENGAGGLAPADLDALFARRYPLSPATDAAAFATPALRADLQRLRAGLQSDAAPLVERYGLPDPTGAFPALLAAWAGPATLRIVHGVWFARQSDRALILAGTRAGGMDLGGQRRAARAIADAFAGARPGHARLLQAGPPVFAREAAARIRADVLRVSVLSTILIAALLLWRFRSLAVVAIIAAPVIVAVGMGALAVQLVFGFVHGVALGFGITMLGVTVDYPVLLIGHRKRGEAATGTLRRIGRTFALAAATATLGLSGMLGSGFPGLAQLGLFALVGVLTAALVTRFLLPPLLVRAELAPVASGSAAWLARVERLRLWRAWAVLPVLAAALYLVARGGPTMQRDLTALSPVPQSAQRLYAGLQRELGAPEGGVVEALRGADAEAVLAEEEALAPALARLVDAHAIAAASDAAQYLPSEATQRARLDALPPAASLAGRVADAARGLGFAADAFAPFEADVARARAAGPLGPEALRRPLLRARIDPLIFPLDGGWTGLVAPVGLAHPAAFRAAFAHVPGAVFVDSHDEADRLVARDTRAAWRWLGLGALAAALAILAVLRDLRQAARVLGAIASALVVTVAILTLAGVRLSLIHVVALQFVAGVGLDYALFFARRQLDAEERSRTLRTLVTCNAMSLASFGLLALTRTPLLRDIGATVAIGVVAAMCFAFLFAGSRRAALEPASAPGGEPI